MTNPLNPEDAAAARLRAEAKRQAVRGDYVPGPEKTDVGDAWAAQVIHRIAGMTIAEILADPDAQADLFELGDYEGWT